MTLYAVGPILAVGIAPGLLLGSPSSPVKGPRPPAERATRAAVESSSFLPIERDAGSRGTVNIDNRTFAVDIADEPNERERGLSSRKELRRNKGMLFVYESPRYPGFWMKGMKFPLDIIYISGNRVVTIVRNAPPPKTPTEHLTVYRPRTPADKVLEIGGGLAGEYGLREGATAEINAACQ